MTELSKSRKLVVLGAGLVLVATPLLAACGGSSGDAASSASAAISENVNPSTEAPASNPAGGVKLANGEAPADRTIQITGSKFSPETLTIKVGQNVTFKAGDKGTYGVKVGDLDGATVSGGLIETFDFSKPGTYSVVEDISSNAATITVE